MARFRSVRVLGVVIATLGGLSVGLPAVQAGTAQGATEVLPDLVADAPANPQLQTYAQAGGTTALLLRFDGFIHNRGAGAVEMRGSQRVDTSMTLTAQRVYRSDGTFFDDPSRHAQILWEPADGHDHWHLKNAARYSLWNLAKTAETAPAMKVGFCQGDTQRIETNGPSSAQYTYPNGICGQHIPLASSVFMGVSAGWRDRYDRTLSFQWVDVSNVPPGAYWLRSEIDPYDFVRESNEVNPATFATSSSTIPGYGAKPVNAGVVSMTSPTTIPLATDSFGSGLGARAFRIIVSPRHGRLNVGGGSLFSTPSVTYTPNAGWVGPDSFTYEAHDSTSNFPAYPATAAVTLNVGGVSPNVAISGAPTSMLAGTSARLYATVLGEDPFVNWTVDGVDAGTPQTGTVDSWGLYQAPDQAPPSGQVTIRATTRSGVWSEVTVAVTDPPPPQAAPATESELALAGLGAPTPAARTGGAPASGHRLRARLHGVRVSTDGVSVIVGLHSAQAGMVRVRVHKGARLLGRCRVRTPRGRPLTCRAPLPRGSSPVGARIVITLRVKGKLIEVVRTSLSEIQLHADHHP